jgi:hypothetical protein
VLQVALGLYLLLQVAMTARWAPLLWGPSGLAETDTGRWGATDLLARLFSSDARVYVALALVACGGALLVHGRAPRTGALLALLPLWLLFNRLPGLPHGGDKLARLLLVAMLLLAPRRERSGPLRTWLHNMGVLLVAGQTCLVYVSAAIAKSSGEAWRSGTATYLVSQHALYTPDLLRPLLAVPAVAALTTYGVLLLQAWYPLALASRVRHLWLAAMLSFHLYTALFMGIPGFGLVMVGVNLFMVTDAEYAALARRAEGLLARLARRLPAAGRLLGWWQARPGSPPA